MTVEVFRGAPESDAGRGAFAVSDSPTRRLVWVPIVHSQEDLGRLRESVRDHHVARRGAHDWDEHVRTVDALWETIRRGVAALDVDPGLIRVYQDGLPVCGKEAAIVADLAAAGSANHLLLSDLIAAGATLEGTEAPGLLLQEYELALKLLGGRGLAEPAAAKEFERHGRELLASRDRFIADRIDRTLRRGETGIVFLGALHSLGPYLPADVRVERLATGLPAVSPGR